MNKKGNINYFFDNILLIVVVLICILVFIQVFILSPIREKRTPDCQNLCAEKKLIYHHISLDGCYCQNSSLTGWQRTTAEDDIIHFTYRRNKTEIPKIPFLTC